MPKSSTMPGRRFWIRTSASRDQPLQAIDVGRAFDVQRDRSLGAVVAVETHRIAVDEGRAPQPRIVAAVGLLDLDHVGAEIGQDDAGQRSRQGLADFDHLDACKQSRHLLLCAHVGLKPDRCKVVGTVVARPPALWNTPYAPIALQCARSALDSAVKGVENRHEKQRQPWRIREKLT